MLRLRLSKLLQHRNRTRAHGYDSPEFEALAHKQCRTVNPEARATLVGHMLRAVAAELPTLPLYVPDQLTISPVKQVFTAWHPTQGGVWGGYPGPLNKYSFITGRGPE